jgi:TM2 domain-containing membrane protein YozV
MTNQKTRTIAFLLCFFLGGVGAHQMYVGNGKRGIVMLLMTFSIILCPVSAIMGFIDLIKILSGSFKGADGVAIKNW